MSSDKATSPPPSRPKPASPTVHLPTTNPFQRWSEHENFPPFLEAITEKTDDSFVSANLSIGALAALNEHWRYVAKYGFDAEGSIDTSRMDNDEAKLEGSSTIDDNDVHTASPSRRLDVEWDRLLDGSLSHVSMASSLLCDAPGLLAARVMKHNQHQMCDSGLCFVQSPPTPSPSRRSCVTLFSTPHSIEINVLINNENDSDDKDGSSYFDSSRVWELTTPERIRNISGERGDTLGGIVTRRGGGSFDYEESSSYEQEEQHDVVGAPGESMETSPTAYKYANASQGGVSLSPGHRQSPSESCHSLMSSFMAMDISRISGIGFAGSHVASPSDFDAGSQVPSVALFSDCNENIECVDDPSPFPSPHFVSSPPSPRQSERLAQTAKEGDPPRSPFPKFDLSVVVDTSENEKTGVQDEDEAQEVEEGPSAPPHPSTSEQDDSPGADDAHANISAGQQDQTAEENVASRAQASPQDERSSEGSTSDKNEQDPFTEGSRSNDKESEQVAQSDENVDRDDDGDDDAHLPDGGKHATLPESRGDDDSHLPDDGKHETLPGSPEAKDRDSENSHRMIEPDKNCSSPQSQKTEPCPMTLRQMVMSPIAIKAADVASRFAVMKQAKERYLQIFSSATTATKGESDASSPSQETESSPMKRRQMALSPIAMKAADVASRYAFMRFGTPLESPKAKNRESEIFPLATSPGHCIIESEANCSSSKSIQLQAEETAPMPLRKIKLSPIAIKAADAASRFAAMKKQLDVLKNRLNEAKERETEQLLLSSRNSRDSVTDDQKTPEKSVAATAASTPSPSPVSVSAIEDINSPTTAPSPHALEEDGKPSTIKVSPLPIHTSEASTQLSNGSRRRVLFSIDKGQDTSKGSSPVQRQPAGENPPSSASVANESLKEADSSSTQPVITTDSNTSPIKVNQTLSPLSDDMMANCAPVLLPAEPESTSASTFYTPPSCNFCERQQSATAGQPITLSQVPENSVAKEIDLLFSLSDDLEGTITVRTAVYPPCSSFIDCGEENHLTTTVLSLASKLDCVEATMAVCHAASQIDSEKCKRATATAALSPTLSLDSGKCTSATTTSTSATTTSTCSSKGISAIKHLDHRRFRTVVPVRVFLDSSFSSEQFYPGGDSFATPRPDEESSYARLYAEATEKMGNDGFGPKLSILV
ncbi:hypothetical protein ACA910_001348 [Epithemia clementina (nom. ined.)]